MLLADTLCGSAGLTRPEVTQVMIGSPGIYDPRRDAIAFIGGQLHRGAHGVAGEIAYLPLAQGNGASERDARRRGSLEAAASAAGVVRAARRTGLRGPVSARRVFALAARGDERAPGPAAARDGSMEAGVSEMIRAFGRPGGGARGDADNRG